MSLDHLKKYGINHLQTKLLINGEWVPSIGNKTFSTYNPATGEKIIDVCEGTKEDIDKAVKSAREAFKTWSKTSGMERARLLYKLADLIEEHKEELARVETLDNGKPLRTHSLEVDLPQVIRVYRYYAGWADKISGKTVPVEGNFFSYTKHEPVGIAGQVIPWNFPLMMQAWKFGPALAAGCTCILKPSKQTPLSALRVGELMLEAGFPPGVINIIPGDGSTIGEYIARHPDIDKIAFTGSTDVGKKILKCSAESNLKRVSLELGGKGPQIVFSDYDLDKAVRLAHYGLFFNMGQCCGAASRVYVEESIYDEFVKQSAELAKKRKVGDPFAPDTEQGPQIDEKQFNRILKYIDLGKKEGATLVTGGNRWGDKGYFIEPTIFSDVKDEMTIARDEIFGPVMCIMKFKDLDEVIHRANQTWYGLTAGVVTSDFSKALAIANNVQSGTVWINCWNMFDAAQPYGGYKESGMGRELGEAGLMNYMESKSVMIHLEQPKIAKKIEPTYQKNVIKTESSY
jgi:aldehyde dehydrogenase (NAD+)